MQEQMYRSPSILATIDFCDNSALNNINKRKRKFQHTSANEFARSFADIQPEFPWRKKDI